MPFAIFRFPCKTCLMGIPIICYKDNSFRQAMITKLLLVMRILGSNACQVRFQPAL